MANASRCSGSRDRASRSPTELKTSFVYAGGEIFRFTGDDDLFVFVGAYALDVFHAERHTTMSTFRIEITIGNFE